MRTIRYAVVSLLVAIAPAAARSEDDLVSQKRQTALRPFPGIQLNADQESKIIALEREFSPRWNDVRKSIAEGEAPAWREESIDREFTRRLRDVLSAQQRQTRVVEALRQPTALEFVDTPLCDVLYYIRDLHKLPIRLDRPALLRRNELDRSGDDQS